MQEMFSPRMLIFSKILVKKILFILMIPKKCYFSRNMNIFGYVSKKRSFQSDLILFVEMLIFLDILKESDAQNVLFKVILKERAVSRNADTGNSQKTFLSK